MAFTVEDGTGVTGANAYVSLSEANTYFTDRNRTEWTATTVTDSAKQAALVRATDHIERRFAHRFKGQKASESNALSWPREGVTLNNGQTIEDNEMPDQLKRACMEYARLALDRTELDPVATEVGTDQTGRVQGKVTTRKVGSLQETTDERYEDLSIRARYAQEFGDKKPSSNVVSEASLQEYPAADLFLEQLIFPFDARDDDVGACPVVSGQSGDKRFDAFWDDQYDYHGGYSNAYNRYGYK